MRGFAKGVFCCGAYAFAAFAQASNPVAWTVKSAPHSAVKAGARFEITVAGAIEPGWHVYAMEEPDGGPVATQVGLAEGDPAEVLRVSAKKPQFLHDTSFNLDTPVYLNSAEFTLHLQAAAASSTRPLHVLVRYQTCNNSICLPPQTRTIEVPLQIGN